MTKELTMEKLAAKTRAKHVALATKSKNFNKLAKQRQLQRRSKINKHL